MRQIFRFLIATLVSAGLLMLASCQGSRVPDATSPGQTGAAAGDLQLVRALPAPVNTAGGVDQPLLPGDVLTIDVFQAAQLSRTVQIDSRGALSLPLIGTVNAAGKGIRALELELEQLYGARYLQNPEVSIFLKESTGQRVTVDGEVAKSGLYPVSPGTTLLDAIALAGGFRELADQRKVYVYRVFGQRKLVANYDVGTIRDGHAENPRVYGGDVVVVFRSQSLVAMNNLKEALGLSARVATGIAALP
jgi:polysaccharide biosynthesis/export protein